MNKKMVVLATSLWLGACSQAPVPDARIAAVADRLAIDQLVAGDYPRALDGRDWDAYAALFVEDGELALGAQTVRGHDGIKGLLNGLPAEPRVIHIITNLSYSIDGDAASGGAYWQDIGVGDVHGVLAAGHYVDSLRKVNGTWKFTKREIVVELGEAPDNPPPASE